MKNTLAAATAVAAMGLLAACSGAENGGTTPSGDVGGGLSGEVVIWTLTPSDTEAEAWPNLVAAFEAMYPGVNVTTETRSTDQHKDALRQAAGTSSAPDIYRYWAGSGLGGELVNVGLSKDLTDYYDQYGWSGRFTDVALSGVTQYGGYHGVPWVQPGEAIYYNKALFDQAGIDGPPTTYDELVAAADALAAAGVTPIEFGGTVGWDVMRLLDSIIEATCGADKADELTKGDGDWGAEACVTESFEELKLWGDEYVLDGFMAMSNEDSEAQFFAGEVAMALEGTWFETFILDNGMDADNIGLFAFPAGTGRLYGFGEAFYVTESSDNPDAAAAFLDFLTSDEGRAALGDASQPLGVFQDFDPSTAGGLTPNWAELFESATGLYTNNDQNFSTAVTTEYWRIQNSVLIGEIAPADAGAQFQSFRESNQ